MPRAETALIAYSGIVTAALAWLLLSGAAPSRNASFDTIEVNRIDLREPDGTLRMAIASRGRFPGAIYGGVEHPHPGRTDSAGMIFYNDEGNENGGLIFGGRKADGKVTNFGHLSFDQYGQDQVAALEQREAEGSRDAGLTISDRPDAPLDFALADRIHAAPPAERARLLAEARASGRFGHPRLFLGKDEARASLVALRDADGRERLRLRVGAGGDAAIEFLDADGKVVKTERP